MAPLRVALCCWPLLFASLGCAHGAGASRRSATAAPRTTSELSADARRARDHVVRVSYEELRANLAELEAKFDTLFEARAEVLRSLEGRAKPAPRPRPEPTPTRAHLAAHCREEALRLIDDELARVERAVDAHEWEQSPRSLRMRRDQQRLRALAADLDRRPDMP